MTKSRKRHSAEFKAKVALEAAKEIKTLNELASLYGVHPGQISQWKNQLLESVPTLFSKQKIDTNRSKEIDDLYRQIGQVPILDWPIGKMDIMFQHYKDRLLTIYIEPDSIEELAKRLANDARDKDGKRFAAGKEELDNYYEGKYDHLINAKIVNRKDEDQKTAEDIYQLIFKE